MFARNQFFDGTEVVQRDTPLPFRRERPRPRLEPVDHEAAQSCELGRWLAERRAQMGRVLQNDGDGAGAGFSQKVTK